MLLLCLRICKKYIFAIGRFVAKSRVSLCKVLDLFDQSRCEFWVSENCDGRKLENILIFYLAH